MFDLQPPRHISTLPNRDLILRRSEMTRCAIHVIRCNAEKQRVFEETNDQFI